MEVALRALILGIVATLAIDVWATFSNKLLKLPRTNWAMVGRWLGHIPSGTFSHNPINAAPPIKNELLLGWLFHYLIGLFYAAVYVVFVYIALGQTPTLLSAWLFGLVTILSPWLIMQPCLGLGIFAYKAPRPKLFRLQNLVIHSIFGVALYYTWIGANAIL